MVPTGGKRCCPSRRSSARSISAEPHGLPWVRRRSWPSSSRPRCTSSTWCRSCPRCRPIRTSSSRCRSIERALHADAERQLLGLTEELTAKGLTVHTVVGHGDPGSENRPRGDQRGGRSHRHRHARHDGMAARRCSARWPRRSCASRIGRCSPSRRRRSRPARLALPHRRALDQQGAGARGCVCDTPPPPPHPEGAGALAVTRTLLGPIALAVALGAALPASSSAQVPGDRPAGRRPRIGLALGGGSARALATSVYSAASRNTESRST